MRQTGEQYTMNSLRQRIVTIARGELNCHGKPEYFLDTLPGNPAGYTKGGVVGAGINWCGIFCLWCLHRAELARTWRWRIGIGFLYRLPRVRVPEHGDIAYFHPKQHQAIISELEGSLIGCVNGDGAGGRVTEGLRPAKDAACFFSIGPLIAQAGGRTLGQRDVERMDLPEPPAWDQDDEFLDRLDEQEQWPG